MTSKYFTARLIPTGLIRFSESNKNKINKLTKLWCVTRISRLVRLCRDQWFEARLTEGGSVPHQLGVDLGIESGMRLRIHRSASSGVMLSMSASMWEDGGEAFHFTTFSLRESLKKSWRLPLKSTKRTRVKARRSGIITQHQSSGSGR